MVSQSYCGVFDKQSDAETTAGFFKARGYQITGPTQYDIAEMDSLIGGKQTSVPAASAWLVIATVGGAAARPAQPAREPEREAPPGT